MWLRCKARNAKGRLHCKYRRQDCKDMKCNGGQMVLNERSDRNNISAADGRRLACLLQQSYPDEIMYSNQRITTATESRSQKGSTAIAVAPCGALHRIDMGTASSQGLHRRCAATAAIRCRVRNKSTERDRVKRPNARNTCRGHRFALPYRSPLACTVRTWRNRGLGTKRI